MTASERKRVALRSRLAEVLGEEEAEVLMDSLPPMTWHDLATKDDLKATNKAIEANRAAIEANRAAIEANKAAIEANRAAIEASEQRLRTEMDGNFAKVDAEFTKLRGDMALQFAKQTRTMVFAMLAIAVPTWGSILAVGLS